MLAHSEMAASVRPRRPWFAVRRLIAGSERDDGGDREDIGVRVRVRHDAQRLTIQGPSGDSKKGH